MARQQSEFPSNGRQGELQVQRGADMPPRDTELRDLPTRDTTVRERSLGEVFVDELAYRVRRFDRERRTDDHADRTQ